MNNCYFSSFYLEDEIYKEYNVGESPKFLNNLSQINLFVGANNSGKSRLLRKLFSNEEIKFMFSSIDLKRINELLKNFGIQFDAIRNTTHGTYYEDLVSKISTIPIYPALEKHVEFHRITLVFDALKRYFSNYGLSPGSVDFIANQLVLKYHSLLKELVPAKEGVTVYSFSNIYIPTLRGLRPIQTTSSNNDMFNGHSDNYYHRTVADYFKGSNVKDNIYTGLSFYEDLNKHKRGNIEQQSMVEKFEKFLSETFFNNDKVVLTPTFNSEVVNVRIGSHDEPIYNLGDGIQSLIILTYPLFFNQGKNLKVYIEEPESHLHPGYQRIFIETLLKSQFKSFQYFITTHSNHFLDLTLDERSISIYTFEKKNSNTLKPEFRITNVENSRDSILLLLGARNSSVFLSNCTIWVEGISDRIYLRKYLEIFQANKEKKFREDTHFSFVEYSGNNITHWSFLSSQDLNHPNILVDRLCGKIFLITDSDNADFNLSGKIPKNPSQKAKRHVELKEKLGERYYCLECREIENLLMPEVIKQIIILTENKTNLDFHALKYSSYKTEYLGKFIQENIKGLTKNYSTDSGSILYKVEFAKKAVEGITTRTDLSTEAYELAEKIYGFIETHNT